MTKIFDGKAIRNKILNEVKAKVAKMKKPPLLAVISVGCDELCQRYIKLKKKTADSVGIKFKHFDLPENISQEEIINKINGLNTDNKISGIMVQIPLPAHLDKFEIVNTIDSKKDVDGLRFCGGFSSCFKPPVVLAVLEAIKQSSICHPRAVGDPLIVDSRLRGNDKEEGEGDREGAEDNSLSDCLRDKQVVIVGRGFLVGWPLAQCLEEAVPGLVVVDDKTKNLESITKDADILISATGHANLIKPEMIKKGVVLIDAGTTEMGGEILGDIDPACYEKASFYTPVPGGIGPVTIGKLFENLVK